jgi:RluA family pseudouridine synthase
LTQRRSLLPSALGVLFENADLVAVNKPPGLSAVHDRNRPGEPTAVELLEATHGRIFTVHRIDRDTSGVLLAARNAEAHSHLSAQFEAHSAMKTYLCIVRGHPDWDSKRVDAPLRPNAGRAHRTVIDEANGKPASTMFSVAERFRGLALVVAVPEQGQRHQIRAHLEHLGHPIVCDPLYGDERPLLLSEVKRGYRSTGRDERPLLDRLALHAEQLTFVHPSSGDAVAVIAPLAADIEVTLKQLRRWASL